MSLYFINLNVSGILGEIPPKKTTKPPFKVTSAGWSLFLSVLRVVPGTLKPAGGGSGTLPFLGLDG